MKVETKASKMNSLPQRGPFTGLLGGDERGNVVVIVSVLLGVILGFAVLAIDLGWLFVVKGELQNAADAGALAGVVELLYEGEDDARATAVAYATRPDQFRLNRTHPKADAVNVTVLGPETLQVSINRTGGTTAGPVPNIFARIWGRKMSEVGAVAVATLNHRIIGTGPGNLMPFGIHEDMLKGLVDSDGDGVYDSLNIFPKSWTPGNYALLNLNGGSTSNAESENWIRNGYDDFFVLPETGCKCIEVGGTTGISGSSLIDALNSRYGDTVLFPVFDKVVLQGAITIYRVVGFVGATITGTKLTGPLKDRYLSVGITDFSAQNLIVGGGSAPNNPTVSAPGLIR